MVTTAFHRLLLLFVFSPFFGLSCAWALPQQLKPFAWDNRILLIFSPSATDERLRNSLTQIQQLECDISDRDLIIGLLVPGKATLDNRPLTDNDQDALRTFYKIAPQDFKVVLIGKDRYEKYRRDRFIPNAVFGEIDGMPMRQQEMEERGYSC